MQYTLIVTVASVALGAAYVFTTEVAYWLKALVVALLLFSFVWRYGFYLQLGLGVSLSLYFTYVKSR